MCNSIQPLVWGASLFVLLERVYTLGVCSVRSRRKREQRTWKTVGGKAQPSLLTPQSDTDKAVRRVRIYKIDTAVIWGMFTLPCSVLAFGFVLHKNLVQ